MKKENYLELLENVAIPYLRELKDRVEAARAEERATGVASVLTGDIRFMQDNAPCHRAHIIRAVHEEHETGLIFWPAYSPDLNPIENLWGTMKRSMPRFPNDTPRAQLSQMLKDAILAYWGNLTDERAAAYCKNTTGRAQDCLARGGKHTGR